MSSEVLVVQVGDLQIVVLILRDDPVLSLTLKQMLIVYFILNKQIDYLRINQEWVAPSFGHDGRILKGELVVWKTL